MFSCSIQSSVQCCAANADLKSKPRLVDLAIEEGQRMKIIYASESGFHAIDLDSSTTIDLYKPNPIGVRSATLTLLFCSEAPFHSHSLQSPSITISLPHPHRFHLHSHFMYIHVHNITPPTVAYSLRRPRRSESRRTVSSFCPARTTLKFSFAITVSIL